MKRQREEVKEEEDSSSLVVAAMAVAVAAAVDEEEKLWCGGHVVEEMTWSTVWLPFWDVEFVGRNYNVLFSDVVWDDDIWNLKNLTHSS
ncbi:unnamed protein product [Cochlearia groenlandica]